MDFSSNSLLLFNSNADDDYILSPTPDFCKISPSLMEENVKNGTMWNEKCIFPVGAAASATVGNGYYSSSKDIMCSEMENGVVPSCFEMSSFLDDQQLGLIPAGIEMTETAGSLLPAYDDHLHIGFYDSSSNNINTGGVLVDQYSSQFLMKPETFIFDDNNIYEGGLFRASSEIQVVYGGSNVWPNQENCSLENNLEEPSMKIRRYTEEERKDRIHKYLKKRNQRNFNKTIKYACRKTLADRRIRIRGRFARNKNERISTSEEEEEHTLLTTTMRSNNNDDNNDDNDNNNNNHNNHNNHNNIDHLQEQGYRDHGSKVAQKKHENGIGRDDDDEKWLEDAITSLMYLPIFANS